MSKREIGRMLIRVLERAIAVSILGLVYILSKLILSSIGIL